MQHRLVVTMLALCGCADEPIVPAGPHHTYVISDMRIDGSRGGGAWFGLANIANGGIFYERRAAVARGEVLQLVDVQTPAFASTDSVGVTFPFGASPIPTPCIDETDAVCGHHLDGTGVFAISEDSPSDPPLVGGIDRNDDLRVQGKSVSIQIPIALGAVVVLEVLDANFASTDPWERTLGTAGLTGYVRERDLNADVLPTIRDIVQRQVDACVSGPPPYCTCSVDLVAALLRLIDAAPGDCVLSTDEIRSWLEREHQGEMRMRDGDVVYPLALGITGVPATIAQ